MASSSSSSRTHDSSRTRSLLSAQDRGRRLIRRLGRRDDDYIIEYRGKGWNSIEIAQEMDISAEAVQGRWYELQQQKKVPEHVLAIWKKKAEVLEDETILRAWIDGKSEDDIVHSLRFEDKYQCDIRQRFKHLYREKGPMYRRLMGMEESRPLPHVLDKALGKKKYAWM